MARCPMLDEECIRDGCVLWIKIWGRPVDGGQPKLDEDCAFNWQVVLLREQLVEQERLTAGVDKASNQNARVANAIEQVRVAIPAAPRSAEVIAIEPTTDASRHDP